MSSERLGIDLGSKTIKIGWLTPSEEGGEVIATAVYPVTAPFCSKQYFKQFAQHLVTFTQTYELRHITMGISLPPFITDVTTAHVMVLPTANEKTLKKAVRFEIEEQKLVPDLSDTHYLWEVLDVHQSEETRETGQTTLLLGTIKKQILYELAQIRKPTWKIDRVELQTATFGRVITGNEVIIDFGYEATRLYLYKEGVLNALEKVGNGEKGLAELVRDDLNVASMDVAEALIRQARIQYGATAYTYPSETVETVSHLATQELDFLLNEIKRIVRGFELREDLELDHVYYTGGVAHLQNFLPLLKRNLDYPISTLASKLSMDTGQMHPPRMAAPPVSRASVKEKGADAFTSLNNWVVRVTSKKTDTITDLVEATPDTQPRMAPHSDTSQIQEDAPDSEACLAHVDVALATALIGQANEKSPSNYAQFLKYKYDLTSLLVALTMLSLTLQMGVTYVSKAYDTTLSDLNHVLSERTAELATLTESTESLTAEKEEHEGVVARVKDLQTQKQWVSEFFYQLPDRTPQGVAVSHVEISGQTILMEGYASNYSDIGLLAMQLEDLGTSEITEIVDLTDSQKQAYDIVDTDQLPADMTVKKTFKITLTSERKE